MANYSKSKFYNPIYDFFSIIVFITANNYLSVYASVIIGCASVFVLAILGFIFRSELLHWNIFRILGSLFMASCIFFFIGRFQNEYLNNTFPIIIISFYLIFLLIFQKRIKRIDQNKISITNFYNEFFRLTKIFLFILISYLILFFIASNLEMFEIATERSIYYIFIFVIIYEFIRVNIIRCNLKQEEWYPILNEKGDVIGKVEKKESILGKEKYLHPIIRVHIISNNTIYLQKRKAKELIFPEKWDTAISNHLLFGETIEECIHRTAKIRYGLKGIKPVYLTKYIKETNNEKQLAFVYYVKGIENLKRRDNNIQESRFWTIKQIMEELNSGIFTENFVSEFEELYKKNIYTGELFEE